MRKLDMKENQTPGRLITFCGLDGSGKTTLMRHLIADLEQKTPLLVTKQPTNAVRNSEIFRTYMDCPNHDAFDYRSLSLLAASDRIQHGSMVIEPAMEQGKTVISDRYFYSCLANLWARGYVTDTWIYEIASFTVKPDIAVFCDVPVEIAVRRVKSRPEEKDRYIDMELQYRLRDAYLAICEANGGVLISTELPEEECYRILTNKVRRMKK